MRRRLSLILLAASLQAGTNPGFLRAQTVSAPAALAAAAQSAAPPAAYAQHLDALIALTQRCQHDRNPAVSNPAACDVSSVGPDDKVQTAQGESLINYDWLRDLLHRAAEPDPKLAPKTATAAKSEKAAPAAANHSDDNEEDSPAPGLTRFLQPDPPIAELLQTAVDRLKSDREEAVGPAPLASPETHPAARQNLERIIARKEFQQRQKRGVFDWMLEQLGKGLNWLFELLAGYSSHAPWLGTALLVLLIVAALAAIVALLIRAEQAWRLQLPRAESGPMHSGPAARDWQLWLADAREAAARHAWRDAIHFLYWASIARLESRRTWPPDRARTPREYLSLLPREDDRQPHLALLTRRFEQTWYGGREALEEEYRNALESALHLGVQ